MPLILVVLPTAGKDIYIINEPPIKTHYQTLTTKDKCYRCQRHDHALSRCTADV